MSDTSPRIADLSRSITVGQGVTIAGVIIVVVTGIFGLGAWLQSSRSDVELLQKNTEISEKNKTINEKDKTISDLTTKYDDQKRAVDALTGNLQQAFARVDALETKDELLTRLAGYLQYKDEVNRKLLENVVCSMWKQSEQKRIRLDKQPVRLSYEDLRRGLPPDVEKLLVSQGVSSELLTRLRTNNFLPREEIAGVGPLTVRRPVQVNPYNDPDTAAATVSKSASNVTVIKVITFADGASFEMPQEIAASVHMRADCAP
jgi:hypothetical protein